MADLEIKIRTILEGQGIKVTDSQLKDLVRSTTSASKATEGVTTTAKDAGRAISDLGKVGNEAGNALNNLERGGISGMVGALKNVGNIVRTLATSAFGAVLIPVLATVGVAFAVLSKAANDAQASLKKDFDEMTKNSEMKKDAIVAANKAIIESFKAEEKAMDSVRASMAELDKQMAASAKRTAELTASKRELILATLEAQGLSTDAAKADFAKVDALNNGMQGENEVLRAEEKIRELDAQEAKAFTNVTAARSQADILGAAAERYGTSSSPEAFAARARAIAAQQAIATAEGEFAKLKEGNAPARAQEDQRRLNGYNTQDISKNKLKTIEQQSVSAARPAGSSSGSSSSSSPASSGSLDQQRAAISQASFSGAISPQAAVDALKKLKEENASLNKAIVQNATASAAAAANTTRQVQKQTQALQLAVQSGPGGGM